MRKLRVSAVVLGLTARLLVPSSAVGQESVPADPGDIVTAPVPVPPELLGAAGGDVSYAVEAPAGVIVISSAVGTFTWEEGDPLLLPVTLRVPSIVRPGPIVGLNVVFALSGERSRVVPVPVSVRASHRLDVDLVAEQQVVERGDMANFRYALSNLGNSTDSVRLELMAGDAPRPAELPMVIWIEPSQTIEGEFRLPISSTAAIGSSEYVRLTAAGSDSQGADHAIVVVAADQGLFPNLVQIPTAIFLGSTVSTNGTATAAHPLVFVSGGGKAGRNTDVLFSYRLRPEGSVGYAFRGLFSGPGLYLAVRRPSWEAAAGDLNPRMSPLLGYTHQSRGLNGAWQAGRVSLSAIGGRPLAPDGGVSTGYVAAVELGYRLGFTRTAVLLSSTERDSPGFAESSVRAALFRVEGGLTHHTFGADVGPMRIEDRRTGEVVQGPSLNARYAYRNRARSLDLRALLLPKLAADPRLPVSQLRASGTLPLIGNLTARASAFNEEAARTSYLEGSRVTGGEAGLRFGAPGWSAGIVAVGREVTGRVEGGRRNIRLDGTTRIGTLHLDGTVALGESRLLDVSEFFQRYRLGASWRGSRSSFNLNLTYADDLLQPASLLVDASATYQVTDGMEVFGVVSSFTDQILDGVPLRTMTQDLTARLGAAVRVGRSLNLYAGIERLSSGAGWDGEWRFSAGVQQGVPLPLPVRRPPVVSGLVYEDVDGDGSRGLGDLLLDGTTLRMGFERVVSRPGGRFEFHTADLTTVTVDTRSLGVDYLPMADIPVPDDRYMEIGVTRSASLRVSAFLDNNGNGEWDAGELPADRVQIVVRRQVDEAWELTTGADGSVSLGSVRPGSFVVSVVRASLPHRALMPDLLAVPVIGGEQADVRIPIPMRQISFSQFGDSGIPCEGKSAVCDDD
jgi:hypothetical protein